MTPSRWVTTPRPTEVMECSGMRHLLKNQLCAVHRRSLSLYLSTEASLLPQPLSVHLSQPRSFRLIIQDPRANFNNSGSQAVHKRVKSAYPATCSTCSPLDRMRQSLNALPGGWHATGSLHKHHIAEKLQAACRQASIPLQACAWHEAELLVQSDHLHIFILSF